MVAKEQPSALQNTADTKKSAVFYFVMAAASLRAALDVTATLLPLQILDSSGPLIALLGKFQ